jgi:hypothetical protein
LDVPCSSLALQAPGPSCVPCSSPALQAPAFWRVQVSSKRRKEIGRRGCDHTALLTGWCFPRACFALWSHVPCPSLCPVEIQLSAISFHSS